RAAWSFLLFFFQAEDGIRDFHVTGVQTCALPILPSLIRVMDFQQEQLARSLGEGHRVIHGVAGSGKTMILGYRCAHLAKVSMKPILVLCFNRSLAARLRQVMAEKGLGEKVVVQHFHGWCKEMLAAYNVDAPPGSRDVDAYLAALV